MLTGNDVIQRFQEALCARSEFDKHRECFYVMGLGPKNDILFVHLANMGTIQYHDPIIRECLRNALRTDATSIIVAHNHPSGDPNPSIGDYSFTQALKEACELVDLTLQDHLVLGDPGVFSFARDGGLHMNVAQIKYLG